MKWPTFGRKTACAPRERFSIAALASGWSEPARGYEAQVREGYLANPVVRAAVRLLSEGAGSAPLVVRPEGHDAARLLARPNDGQSGAELIGDVAAHLALHGNAYLEVVRGGDGLPAALHALRPERVTVEAGADGWPAAHVYRAGANAVRFPAGGDDGRGGLLHLKGQHPLDDHYGAGGLQAAALAVATHNAASRWNLALLGNAARPSGALVYEAADTPALSGDQYDRLKAELEASFQGAGNAGRPMLLEGGLRWQAMALTPAELDFQAAKAGAAREIALAFGVPPLLLGLPGDNTYANYAEANVALWRLTLLPLVGRIAGALTGYLQAWWPELAIEIDRDAIPALSGDREKLWTRVSAADFLSAAEKRAMLGV